MGIIAPLCGKDNKSDAPKGLYMYKNIITFGCGLWTESVVSEYENDIGVIVNAKR